MNKNLALAFLVALTLSACGAPQGPRIRYVHASPQQLAAAENEDVVWYEFQPGDEGPIGFLFLGMAEIAPTEVRMVVQRQFWIVVFKDGRTMFSFDGRRLQQNPFSRWGMLIGRGEHRGSMALLMYVGPQNEAPAQLRHRR